MTYRWNILPMGLVMSLVALAGCQNVTRELRHFPELFNPKVNLTEYTYGAADSLVSQAKPDLTLSMPVGIGALNPVNLKPYEKIPPFGTVVADQVGSRLVQLGYHVKDLGISVRQKGAVSERAFLDEAGKTGAQALITGNYTISDYDVLVNLRLVGVHSGRMLASVDYRIPLGSDTYSILGRDPFFALPIPDDADVEQEEETAAAIENSSSRPLKEPTKKSGRSWPKQHWSFND